MSREKGRPLRGVSFLKYKTVLLFLCPVVLFNTQHFTVQINGAIQEKEKHSPQHLRVVANEKEAFGLPSTTVVN